MGTHVEAAGIGKRLAAIIASGALVVSTMGMPMTALATQTGSGATDVTITFADGEFGGTEITDPDDPAYNPDTDGDGKGDNIAFTVPTAINFTTNASGVLTGPSAASTYIENESVFSIHVSSVDVDPESNWNVVESAADANEANAIDFQFGPKGDKLNAYDYLTKASVHDVSKWSMTSAKSAADAVSDRVQLVTSGNINNVSDSSMTGKEKVATIHTYVSRNLNS